jgi:hypothetical protein
MGGHLYGWPYVWVANRLSTWFLTRTWLLTPQDDLEEFEQAALNDEGADAEPASGVEGGKGVEGIEADKGGVPEEEGVVV